MTPRTFQIPKSTQSIVITQKSISCSLIVTLISVDLIIHFETIENYNNEPCPINLYKYTYSLFLFFVLQLYAI